MPSPFSLSRLHCAAASPASLKQEIRTHTGSDSEADSIVRSLERFGGDGSIRFFEITPAQRRRTRHVAPTSTWTVRAVR